MANKVLVDYIRSEKERGIEKDITHAMLVESGWSLSDISSAEQEVFGPKISAPQNPTPTMAQKPSPMMNQNPMASQSTMPNNRPPVINQPYVSKPINQTGINSIDINPTKTEPVSTKPINTIPINSAPTNLPISNKPASASINPSPIIGAIKNYGQGSMGANNVDFGINKNPTSEPRPEIKNPVTPEYHAPTPIITKNINPTNISPEENRAPSASMPSMNPAHSISPTPQMTNLGHKALSSNHMGGGKHYGKIGLTIILIMLILLTGVGIYAYYYGYFDLSSIAGLTSGLFK